MPISFLAFRPVLGLIAFLLGGSCFLSPSANAQNPSGNLPPRGEIIAKCILANDYWISVKNVDPALKLDDNNWAPAAYYTGNQRFIEILRIQFSPEAAKKAEYQSVALAWCEAYGWKHGPKGPTDPDSHCGGQTYIDQYRLDPQAVRLLGVDGVSGIKPTINNIYDEGIASDGDWSWIDTFYMAAPVFAKLDQTVGESEGRDFSAKLKTMYLNMRDTQDLFEDIDGLWYRDAAAKTKITQNGKKEFWSRGNGWVIGGLVKVLDELGPKHPDWTVYASMLQTMSATLIPLQQADGFWRSSLADPADTRWANPETSGTAFFTYAMAWGINNGLLDAATYRPVVAKAWNGMVQTALHPNGKLGWVQQVAKSPGVATYEDTKNYAVGAFLLAGSELSFMAPQEPISPYAGPDQNLFDFDGNSAEVAFLSSQGTLDPNGKAVSYQWFHGTTLIATGVSATVNLGLGIHDVVLRITDDESNVWQDTVRITVSAPLPERIYQETFVYSGSGEQPMGNYGWSVLLTEDGSISNYGTQSRALGVSSSNIALYAPKADDASPWTAKVLNHPALAYTSAAGPINISSLASVAWISSSDNIDHAFRIAIRVGGQWYVSSTSVNDGAPYNSGAGGPYAALSFAPSSFRTASNWRAIQNTTLGTIGTLSLGAAPASDLAGNVTDIGFYLVAGVNPESTGDHMRWDNFEVWTRPMPVIPPDLNSLTFIGGDTWELMLTGEPNGNFEFYSSPDLTFNPGIKVTTLHQGNPAGDPGTVTSGSVLTTDEFGVAKVRMTLDGNPADFVRAKSSP